MDFLQALLLGLLQGLTEFLPISSSAHLILLPEFLHWQDQGRVYDVAAHAGSVLAVMTYFRRDLARLGLGWARSFKQDLTHDGRIAWYLLLATLPVCFAGVLLAVVFALELRDPLIIATATIVFGLLLWWADSQGSRQRCWSDISLRDAVIIGVMQMLALIPGASRSGITITAGLLLGLDRHSASRFSFFLAIPAIIIASGYELLQIMNEQVSVDWLALSIVMVTAFISALVAIHYFLKWLNTIAMLPYVIYRLLLGVFLFFIFIP